MKWLRRSLWGLLAVVVLAAAGLWVYRSRALPRVDGELRVSGLKTGVRIERDAQGIPTIRAASPEDALFGLGFAHAQDRLWQLETHRRIGAGRLTEAFGPAALPTDRFLRALAVQHAAKAQWDALQGPARRGIEAYTAGINAYVHEHLQARPPEFVLLGLQPQDWTPQDTVAWTIMMAWDLGGNWSSELLRMRLALKLPVDRINELLPPYPGEQPLATADYAALFRGLRLDGDLGRQALAAAPPSGIEGLGSNNWVVAGSHSETGAPLLANDPHLKLTTPALWYLARLDAPGLKVAGATMPGLPIVVLGQNEHVAWGFTNTGPDVQDLYIERIKPDDAAQYQTPTGWAPFETRQESIKVRGAADVNITVRSTRHGPVISDAGEVAEGLTGPKGKPAYALAMRWTALDPDVGTLEAGLAFNQARSVAEFVAASAKYAMPMQNMVVADRAGHIGEVSAGKVPLRSAENDLKGLVPAPGWDARYDWVGFLPPEQTPRELDPPRGWIATANQRIHTTDYPHFLSSEWAMPYRYQRIERLLQAKPKHTLESLAAIQRDDLSLATQRLLPFIRAAQANHPLAAAAQRELADFDGRMVADRAAPAIFYAWVRHLARLVLADEMGRELYQQQLGGRSFRDALELILERNDSWWCDDKSTPVVETCAQQSAQALRSALDELQGSLGPDVSAWRWGRLHVARAEHRPFSSVPVLARWFELRAPVGGDSYTINVSRVGLTPDATTGELYLDEHGPSLRALYDLQDPARSRFMHSSGQSGLVFSSWYGSFLRPWTEGGYVPLWNAEPARHVLTLTPG